VDRATQGAVQILQIAGGRLDLGQHPQLSEVIVEVLVEEIEALHSETQNQGIKTKEPVAEFEIELRNDTGAASAKYGRDARTL